MSGKEIAQALVEWANQKRMHPDDFDVLFVDELMEMLEGDEG